MDVAVGGFLVARGRRDEESEVEDGGLPLVRAGGCTALPELPRHPREVLPKMSAVSRQNALFATTSSAARVPDGYHQGAGRSRRPCLVETTGKVQ
jgi:hypothetical protein